MKVGEFVLNCLRTAGDPTATQVSVDSVLRYMSQAVTMVMGQFSIPLKIERIITVAADFVDLQDRITPVTITIDGQSTSDWYEERGGVRFGSELAMGTEVVFYGKAKRAAYSQSNRSEDLSPYPETGEAQWVPLPLDTLVRYEVIKQIMEEKGDLEKAMFYARMAKDAERDCRRAYREMADGSGSGIVKAVDLFE